MKTNTVSVIPRCGDCRFFDALSNGVCRREPPKAIPMPAPDGRLASLAIWPPVDGERDWCGQYQTDPNAAGDA